MKAFLNLIYNAFTRNNTNKYKNVWYMYFEIYLILCTHPLTSLPYQKMSTRLSNYRILRARCLHSAM